jgi:hypothetical protein
MGIETLTSTEARMDWFRRTSSRGEHVRSDRNLRRLWHQPEDRPTSSDCSHRRFRRCATLPGAGWAVDKDGLTRSAAIAGRIGDLTLHVRQADLRLCHGSRRAPPIGMSALHAPHLKLNGASIRKSTRRWESSGECARGHPRVTTARCGGQLLHCGNLSAAEPHRFENRWSFAGDQGSEGGV